MGPSPFADDHVRGGYHCPHDDCDYTAVVSVLVADHIRDHHAPEEETEQ